MNWNGKNPGRANTIDSVAARLFVGKEHTRLMSEPGSSMNSHCGGLSVAGTRHVFQFGHVSDGCLF